MARAAVGTPVLLVLWAAPAAAHGAGALSGLPLPRWQFAWVVGALVVITFFAVSSSWPQPRLAAAADGVALPAPVAVAARALVVVARVVGVVTYAVIVTAGLFGSEFPAANIAPTAVFITLWVGLQFVSLVLGDLWRVLSPFETLALAGAWARARVRRGALSSGEPIEGAGHWPAAAAMAGFAWLELAYHSPSAPRVLGLLGLGYGVVVLAAAARFGRGWLRTGEGFAVVFGLLAAMAPFHRGDDGRLRVRWPLTGLGRLTVRDGTPAVLFVLLGATVFDGLTRTTFWFDLTLERVGWGYTAVNTLGLAWAIGVVAMVYLGVTRLVARVVDGEADATAVSFAAVLVPVAAGYTVAHYFSLLVLDGQGFWFLASNPYGEGWDLFGTADGTVNLQLLTVAAITWVQAGAIALGHAGAVVVAHDRAISEHPPRAALAAQYVLAVFLVGTAVAAVALLLGT